VFENSGGARGDSNAGPLLCQGSAPGFLSKARVKAESRALPNDPGAKIHPRCESQQTKVFGMKRNETGFWKICKLLKTWWPGTESNRRRQPFQGCALPTELPGRQAAIVSDTRRDTPRLLPLATAKRKSLARLLSLSHHRALCPSQWKCKPFRAHPLQLEDSLNSTQIGSWEGLTNSRWTWEVDVRAAASTRGGHGLAVTGVSVP
jgi:hypothetical protein